MNQEAFGLPSRLIAKKFLFRCIFLGQAHTYANDPEFFDVSSNPKYWQEVIDRFFEKYSGFRKWVDATIRQAVNTGQTSIPTGRIFVYERKPNRHGEMVWPETEIANHPIQGLEAEIMKVYRILLRPKVQEFKKRTGSGIVLFSSIHDSVSHDVEDEYIHDIRKIYEETATEVPAALKKYFGFDFNLPFRVECQYGKNFSELVEF